MVGRRRRDREGVARTGHPLAEDTAVHRIHEDRAVTGTAGADTDHQRRHRRTGTWVHVAVRGSAAGG
jgi:hypothetical protein